MDIDEQIRLTFPHHLARMYELTRLERSETLAVVERFSKSCDEGNDSEITI